MFRGNCPYILSQRRTITYPTSRYFACVGSKKSILSFFFFVIILCMSSQRRQRERETGGVLAYVEVRKIERERRRRRRRRRKRRTRPEKRKSALLPLNNVVLNVSNVVFF